MAQRQRKDLPDSSKEKVVIRLPAPHSGGQDVFFYWSTWYPKAQVLVAPCGTKAGKSFGASLWMLAEALAYPGLYCAWIAPTYLKCRIAYRYIKSMLPDHPWFHCIDGRLEIHLQNNTFIKFLHGRDAETTIEGEAVDRFVIDEAGKINRQVWTSLLTTITQTRGRGIVTGTPRGYTWYYDLYKMARGNNPYFVAYSLKTEQNPFVAKEAIERARTLLPPHLFEQYFEARFISHGTTFGDIQKLWDDKLKVKQGSRKFWVHPDPDQRKTTVIHGVDIAKKHDYAVFYSVNCFGKLVGFCRFKEVPYPQQIVRLKTYLLNYFGNDNIIRFDATGVGNAFEDMIHEADIDAAIQPVTFTNKSKNEMVTKTVMAMQAEWHKAPRIPVIGHEFTTYELTVTPSGLHRYSAPEGEHDDIVSAAILAISAAYENAHANEAEKLLEQTLNGVNIDAITEMYNMPESDAEFFSDDDDDGDFDFDYESD